MISTKDYRIAFGQYLRKGTPIRLSKKADRQTASYVWRTMQDGKVRTDHRYNDGRIFRWDDPDMLHPARITAAVVARFPMSKVKRSSPNMTFRSLPPRGSTGVFPTSSGIFIWAKGAR